MPKGRPKKIKESFDSVEELMSFMGKEYGNRFLVEDDDDKNVKFTTTNLLSLDCILGGGLPHGRIIEIFGPESSGKTSLALHCAGIALKLGGKACLVDAEYAYDNDYSAMLGAEGIVVVQPEYGEQALNAVEKMVKSNFFDVIIVDSVSALVPKAEVDGETGDHHVGLQARMMSQSLRKLSAIVGRTKCRLIFINQIRQKIGVLWGNPETTSGGNALKFYSSIRIDVRRIGWLGGKENPKGIRQRVKIVKNKVAPPFRLTELSMYFNKGYNVAEDILDWAENFAVLDKKENTYYYEGEAIGMRNKTISAICKNKEMRKKLKDEIKQAFEEQI